MNLQELKYPIGNYSKPAVITQEHIQKWIQDLENFPGLLAKEVIGLSDEKLDTEYRPDGWTIRQVVHHCADSHMNSFIRLKLALTEDKPTIKPYFEERWAELYDSKKYPIESSLKIIEGVHQKWSDLLKQLSESDLQKIFIHPQHNKEFSIAENIGLYAWHSNHHLAHIQNLKKRKGWN